MGIESLTKSAEAAGYAMAQSVDTDTEPAVAEQPRVEREGAANRIPQLFIQPAHQLPAVRHAAQPSTAQQMMRSVWNLFGYGAHA